MQTSSSKVMVAGAAMVLLSISGCSESPDVERAVNLEALSTATSALPHDWPRQVTSRWQFQHPPNWEVYASPNTKAEDTIVTRRVEQDDQGFSANVRFGTEDISDATDLEEYDPYAYPADQIELIDAKPFHFFTQEVTERHPDTGMLVSVVSKHYQSVNKSQKLLYGITWVCGANDSESIQTAERVVRSFRFR